MSQHRSDTAPTGALVADLSREVSELVRAELRLARAEMTEKGKRSGLGLGLFGTAGALAWYAGGVLVAAAVLALDLVLPAWAACLVVAGALLAVGGVIGAVGGREVSQATPPAPTGTVESVKQDVAAVRKGAAS